MNEEIKDIVEILELVKEELENNDENTSAILDLQDLKSLKKLYDLYTEAEKERDGIYDDYQDLGKENLKLQEELEQEKEKNKKLDRENQAIYESINCDDDSMLVRLYEQEKNKINTIKKLMSVGDITDEALFTLVQTTMSELERLEGIEEKLDNSIEMIKDLKEKNKELEKHQKQYLDGELITAKQGKIFEKMIKENYISKDKIKEKIEQAEQKADDDNLDEYIKISAWKELLEV